VRSRFGRFALAIGLATLGFAADVPSGHLAIVPPDLAISISDSPDPVLVGHPVTYTVTARNNGPGGAELVTVTDTLPSGVSLGSVSTTQGTCTSGSTISCTLNGLQSLASATITITVTPGTPGVITDHGFVSGSLTPLERNKQNNAASEPTTVKPVADLTLKKTDSPDPVLAGETLTYSLQVTNGGPSGATGVTLTDHLPVGVVFVSSVPACTQTGGDVKCALGALAKGPVATVNMKVTPTKAGVLINTASVSGNESDPVLANNNAAAKTRVKPAADLEIVKSGAPNPVGVGKTLTYVLTVTNHGPSPVGAVAVKDTLPASVELHSSHVSQGSGCAHAGNSLTCHLGTLANGGVATAAFEVKPSQPSSITNTATVQGNAPDPLGGNNKATVKTLVQKNARSVKGADLTLHKAALSAQVAVLGKLTYTLVATNNGPDQASKVTLVDKLPAGLTLTSARSGEASCAGKVNVTCKLDTLAVGALAKVTIVVRPWRAGKVTNTASVTASEPDPQLANNTDHVTTKVVGRTHRGRKPKLVLRPTLGPPGFVTRAIGSHFPAHAHVLLRWNQGLGRLVIRANRSGSFRVPVLIFYHDLLGRRQLIASPHGKPRFSPARAGFLAVPGSLEPPSFQPRG
jgi:uncharacterized repeat protein (TIGR01451 family)